MKKFILQFFLILVIVTSMFYLFVAILKTKNNKIINFGSQTFPTKSFSTTPEPIEYENEKECWPEDGWSWREISGCGNARADKYNMLAEIEENRNKIFLTQSSEIKSYQNKFTSPKYNFRLSYPATWKLTTYDYEDIETIKIYNLLASNTEPAEIIIGTGQAYSTSGALCANQGCDYEGGEIHFSNGYKTTITKSYNWLADDNGIPNDTRVENYRFSVPLETLFEKADRNNYLYITTSFFDENDGNQILDILGALE